jgi:hypothetical protein
MTKHKIVDNVYLHHREVVVQGHYMTHSLTYSYTVLLCSRYKIHRYVAVPHRKGNFWYMGEISYRAENRTLAGTIMA